MAVSVKFVSAGCRTARRNWMSAAWRGVAQRDGAEMYSRGREYVRILCRCRLHLGSILEAVIRHAAVGVARCAPRSPGCAVLCCAVQAHAQFIMQLEPRMVALGFMAAGESYRPGQERRGTRKRNGRRRKRRRRRRRGGGGKRRRETERGRCKGYIPMEWVIRLPRFQYIIYRLTFHYFCLVHGRWTGHETHRFPPQRCVFVRSSSIPLDCNWLYQHQRWIVRDGKLRGSREWYTSEDRLFRNLPRRK